MKLKSNWEREKIDWQEACQFRKKILGEHRKKRGDSQNGKGKDIVLRGRAF